MKIDFTETGWSDYLYWQGKDKKIIKRINQLIQDIDRNGNDGIGKPEAFVYRLQDDRIEISQCRGHYRDR